MWVRSTGLRIVSVAAWFILAGVMVALVTTSDPRPDLIICFVAWLGGVASTLSLMTLLFYWQKWVTRWLPRKSDTTS